MFYLHKIHHYIKYSSLTAILLLLASCSNGMNEHKMLENAKSHIKQGKINAAYIELRNTLQKNNNNAEAHYLLGNIGLKIGDYTFALEQFKQADENGWSKEQIQYGKAQIFLAQEKFQDLLNNLTDDNTWTVETRANIFGLRALAEARLGHTALAKNTLDKGKTLKPDALHILKTTISLQLSGLLVGDPDRTLNEALSLYPNNTGLLLIRATMDHKDKNLSNASDTYTKIINLDPPNTITPYGRKAAIGLAGIHIAQKNYNKAITILARILVNNKNDLEANYLSAVAVYFEKNYSRAENHLHKVLTTLPNHSKSLRLMGEIKYATKDYEQASQSFIKYLKTAPNDLAAQKMLAQAYIFLNQPKKALAITRSLIAYNEEDVITLRLQSKILLNTGDANAAAELLLKAINSQPENLSLHEQLVNTYIASGKTNLALNQIKIIQRLNNNTETAQKLTVSAYMKAGEMDKAISIARKLLEKHPQDSETLLLNASLYASNNDYKQARTYFNRALKLHKKNLPATMGLALIEKKEGHLDKAKSLYKGLVESGMGGASPMLALSKIAAQQKQKNEMLIWLEKARSTSVGEIKSRLILAKHYLQVDQPEKADRYIQEAYKASPENIDVLILRGKILIAQNRYRAALPTLKRLVAILPDQANMRILLSEAYIGLGMIGQAREQLLTVLKINNNHFQALSLLAGTELIGRNFDKSLEYSRKAQKADPDNYIGFLHEGTAWMAKKEFYKARTAYDKAWKIQQTPKLAIRIFDAAKNFSSFEKSIQATRTWLTNNPDDYSMRTFLAAKYQEAKQNDNAIREYETVLVKQQDNSTILNNLAWLYHLKGDSKALDFAEQAYRIEPANASVQDTYGWILVHDAQAEKGKRLIEQALQQIPNNLELKYHYAVALAKSGERNQSKQILENILNQDKAFNGRDDAKQLLDTL